MNQVFHPSWNVISRVTLFGAPVVLALIGFTAYTVERSPYVTRVGEMRDQPVPFSHQHHTTELGIDCRFCHQSVEDEAFAGIPSTQVCMKCHSQIWSREGMLAPVRESYRTGEPLHWTRVHDLPDHAYFDHSIHVNKGIGCSTCHGRVDQMPMTAKAEPMNMQWCLDCHREPERYVRPLDEIYNMAWQPPADQLERGRELLKDYHVTGKGLTNCSMCHR